MKLILRAFFISIFLCAALPAVVAAQNAPLPNPVLIMTGSEYYETGGQAYVRYNYQVFNFTSYPNAMFAPAPALPPCGSNTKAARTWVDFYDQQGKRLYGFCSLGKNSDLNALWFALPASQLPPSWIYIEMTDRQTNTKYKSNLAETTM
jgi:hypothetical protein